MAYLPTLSDLFFMTILVIFLIYLTIKTGKPAKIRKMVNLRKHESDNELAADNAKNQQKKHGTIMYR